MLATIITPTIGSKYLLDCLRSVQCQTYKKIIHYIVVDGVQYLDSVNKQISQLGKVDVPIEILCLNENTGNDGRCGHNIYAALPFLLSSPILMFLDEDNMMLGEHCQYMVNKMLSNESLDMVYTYRSIVDRDGKFICNDNFESVGTTFVDTSTMAIRLATARKYAYLWVKEDGIYKFQKKDRSIITVRPNDRIFTSVLLKECKTSAIQKYTILYRTYDDSPNPTNFFAYHSRHSLVEPWERKLVYLCHFTPVVTNRACVLPIDANKWKEQWQLTLVDGMKYYMNVKDGYLNVPPSGSTVVFTCCFPEMLPQDLIARDDIYKILVAMESPNYRHQRNFELSFINRFDKVITYNDEFEEAIGDRYVHMQHPFNLDIVTDTVSVGIPNKDADRKICCVLENRHCDIEYEILGVKLKCLEYLRQKYAQHLVIDCYGKGWKTEGSITAKGYNPNHPSMIMQDYTFSLIIENQNARGGVTEKIYHALLAGSIPLYYAPYEIPIPDCCYINIADIDPADLGSILQSIDVDRFRDNIYKHRKDIFSNVSVDKFGKIIYDLLK